MKQSLFILIITFLFIIGCSKDPKVEDKCPSSISGRILDRVTEEPVVGVEVFAQGIGETSDWGNSELLPFDTIITNEMGYYEFSTEWNVPNWNVQVFSYGYDFVTLSFWETSCQHLVEDIKLDEFATVNVNTIDNPDLNYDTLLIFTLPGMNSSYYEGDYGTDILFMIPNEAKKMWLKPDPEGLIRYWFINDPKDETYEIEITAEPGELIELNIEM